MPRRDTCRFAWLGTVEYTAARRLQDSLANQICGGGSPDTLLLLEHPHVYTKGRLSSDEHVLASALELASAGVPVLETDRGGQITYHGPGQIVCYPLIDLRKWGGGPLQYVRSLERVILATLADFGIEGHVEPGLTGAWTSGGKIAAIGVKISRGVAFHGFSLNVDPDLSFYSHIVPCGITDRPVTSMAAESRASETVSILDSEAVRYSLVYRFGQEMGMCMVEASAGSLSLAAQPAR